MNKSTEFIELRSEEVQELLTRMPAWTLRWGILVVFMAVGLVFWGAWLVHYPDLISASFKLTSINAPKVLLARTDGRLMRLFAQEGETVAAGKVLAYLESTSKHEEVLRLSVELEKAWLLASKDKLEALDRLNLADYHQLGEMQNAFQTFRQAHIQLRAYLAKGFYAQKEALLWQEIADLKFLAENLRAQRQIQEQDMKLAQEEYDVQRQLAEQKVIASMELKREESKYIARKLAFQQTASSLISNLAAQRATQKEILELEKQVTEQRDNFLQALNTLQSAVEAWKTKYVVMAPVSGRTYFATTLQENQHLTLNQELLYIAPPASNYFGELRVPQQNAGKVQVGQDVLVKFAGYPYQEFGAVRGRIASIAEISMRDSVFMAKVILPTGLTTAYGKKLAYKTGMSASAEIITADSRLVEKLFYQLRKITNER
jgi:multidrug efflux pump subunit AcrA (membrane-fusion protein)